MPRDRWEAANLLADATLGLPPALAPYEIEEHVEIAAVAHEDAVATVQGQRGAGPAIQAFAEALRLLRSDRGELAS